MHASLGLANCDKRQNGRRTKRAPMALDDPLPLPAQTQIWRIAAQAATIGIFIILFFVALDLARGILLPSVSAFVVTMLLGPLSAKADRHGVPQLATAIVLWVLVIVVVYGLIVALSTPVVAWVGKAPDIGASFQQKLSLLEGPLRALRDMRNALLPADAGKGLGIDLIAIVQPAVGIVTPALSQMFIFFGVLFFMLLARNHFRQLAVAFFRKRESRLRMLKIMNDVEYNLTGYLSVVAVINMGVGVGGGIIAWATGLPDPLAWGVLAFVLNFIPYIGALIMEIGMFLVGLVTFPSLTHALIAPAAFIVMAVAEGHFITPSVLGRKFTLSPLTVFFSLVFWTWLWGPIGAFLSVPLLIIATVTALHLFPKQVPELPG